MSTALLPRLRAAGVRLKLSEDDGLLVAGDLTDAQVAFLREHKTDLVNELSRAEGGDQLTPDQEAAINRWLDHVGETAPAIRTEVLDTCRRDPETRAYYLRRSREASDDTGAIRARLLADLEANPDLVRAVEVIDSDADPVRLTVAIRDVGKCELRIDRERWDPFKFLELIEAGGRTN